MRAVREGEPGYGHPLADQGGKDLSIGAGRTDGAHDLRGGQPRFSFRTSHPPPPCSPGVTCETPPEVISLLQRVLSGGGLVFPVPVCISKMHCIGNLRRSGGTGRRAGLKIPSPQGREGSTPSSGTTHLSVVWCATGGGGTGGARRRARRT